MPACSHKTEGGEAPLDVPQGGSELERALSLESWERDDPTSRSARPRRLPMPSEWIPLGGVGSAQHSVACESACTLMPAPAEADAPAPLVLPATGGATRLRQELLSRSCFCCRWQSPSRPGLRSVGTYCGVLQPMKRLLMSRNSRQERFLVHPCRP